MGTSGIDPTHPQSGVPVAKSLSRANAQAAKDEIEALQDAVALLQAVAGPDLLKSWVSEPGSPDWSDYPVLTGGLAAHQFPWNIDDASPGETMTTQLWRARASGMTLLRTTADLSLNTGSVKGAPDIWLGWHDTASSPDNGAPFYDGVNAKGQWSDAFSSITCSTRTFEFKDHSDPGITFWHALQLYAFRNIYDGTAFNDPGSEVFDLQVRFHSNNFDVTQADRDAVVGQYTTAGVTFDIALYFPGLHGAGSGHMLAYPADENYASEVIDFDVLGFIDRCRVLFNAAQGQSDTRWWLWGVETWMEPRSGSIDTATQGLAVTVDGSTYGAL